MSILDKRVVFTLPIRKYRNGPMAADWHVFDKVYCISLDERTDRREEAQAQFAKVGLLENVEFVVVPKHPTDCEQGIYESHLTCMNKGIAAGARHILIFEDDVCFDRFNPHLLDRCANFMATASQWHILFLGCMVKGSRAVDDTSIRQIRYRSLTHAYAIRRSFAEFIVQQHPWHGVPYDDFLRDLKDDQFFAIYPMFAFQSNSRSDNERYLPLDRFRRFCGGLMRLQKNNEFYHRYKWLIIAVHVPALILLWMAL